jgi:nucleoside-diphosphate-sugar epimerase
MKKIVISGATGFIGKQVLLLLPHNLMQDQIILLTRSNFDQKKLDFLTFTPKTIALDLEKNWVKILKENISGHQTLFVHLATSYGSESECQEINIDIPTKVLECLTEQSGDVFINTDSFFTKKDVEHSILPVYTRTKRELFEFSKNYCRTNNIKMVNMRLEHVYGEGDNASKFIPWLLQSLIDNKPVIKLTSCEHVRDFIYVKDVAQAFIYVINELENINMFEEFSVGTGDSVMVKELVLMAKEITKSKSILDFNTVINRNDIEESVGDPKAIKNLGWLSETKLSVGLQTIIDEIKIRVVLP